jgi:hypothetical protein
MATPDLACSVLVDQFTDVSGPEPVKKVQITVSVVNLGDSGATNSLGIEPILVFRDLAEAPDPQSDVPDAVFNLNTLASGAEISFDLDEVTMAPGSYKAWCMVNPDLGGGTYAVADETNFADNVVSKPYIVTPPPIAAPDLIVTSIETTTVGPYEYDFTVGVENIGGAAAGPFQVDVFPDEETEPNWSTPGLFSDVFCVSDGLDAQSSTVLLCSPTYTGWTPFDVGTQAVYAYVDIGSEVVGESDISNNSFSADIEVTAPAELSTTALTVESESGEVTYSVTIDNAGGANATGVSVGLVYQSNFPPNSCDDADEVKVVPFIAAEGSTIIEFQRSGAIGGEGFQAWVIVDCDNTILEGSEGDNVSDFNYDVDGVPNVAPQFGEITEPEGCRETEQCLWSVEIIDATVAGDKVAIRVVDGPAGMWGDTANQGIVYVPPLGSTVDSAEFTVEIDDGLGGIAEQVLTVDVEPRTDFRGIVGQKGALPSTTGNQCALFEIPGTGFIWVDREDYSVRMIRNNTGDVTPLSELSPAAIIPVAVDHNIESPFLSCHVAVAPNGGFLLYEATTQVLLTYGADGTFLRKTPLQGVSSGGEVFTQLNGSTYVFLDTIQDFPFAALYFVDVNTGSLDTTYGSLSDEEDANSEKTGKIALSIVTPADWSSEYLWVGSDRIRLLNRQFSAQGFVDFSFDGQVLAETLFADTPIAGVVPTNPELYLPMAAPDGGLMLQDFSTATLRWYLADFSPRAGFSLAAPGSEAEPGVVSLQTYGYSVDNIRCDVLPAGGWTCHDYTSQHGFVVDEFGDLYDYCPLVSVSPNTLEFGGVTAFETSEKTVTVVNAGSGVFVVDNVSLSNAYGGFADITPGAFPTSPYYLAAGSAVTLNFEYTPTSAGEAGMVFNINAVSDDPLCPASKISIPVNGHSGARLAVTPGIVVFDGVGPGIHKQKVTLLSVGSTSVQLNSVSLANSLNFQMDPPSIPSTVLSPGESIDFDVIFDGTVEGEFITTLDISSNDASNPNAEIPVTARTGPRVELEPPGLGFGAVDVGESLTRTVTIRNVGETSLALDQPVLSGVSSFTLETDDFVSTLAKGESTTLTVRYAPEEPGTRLAKVVVTHNSDAIAPIEILAVAGTGTRLPLGFDGVISFADAYGPIAMTGGAVELDSGGFAAWGNNGGAIYTLDGSGEPIEVLGSSGVITMTGDGGAFPEATTLGASLLELESGDLAMLSPEDGRIYVVRPDGVPNPYVGENGVIDVFSAGDGIGHLASVLAQLNDGPAKSSLLVFDTVDEQLIAVELTGGLAPAFGALGRVGFSSPGAIVGNGAALETGSNLAVRGTGDIIFSDTLTEKFYRLTEIGNAVPGTGTAASYDGVLAAWRTPFETAYYDPQLGALQVFEDAFTSYVFDNGETSLDIASIWPSKSLGPALIILRESGVAVSTELTDQLIFVSEDGTQLSLSPSVSVVLPDSHDFGDVAAGQVSDPLDIEVTNTGTYTLTVSPVFSNGLFKLASGASVVEIAPGSSTTLSVVYAPTSKGQHQSLLQLATNDSTQPLIGTAELVGSTGPDLIIAPDVLVLDFGNVAIGDSQSLTVTLQNQGVADVSVELPSVGPSPFALGDKIVNGVLSPSATGSPLDLVFAPSEEGTFYGFATITHTDTTKPAYTIQLVGRSGAQLKVSPDNLACVGNLGGLSSCGALQVQNVGSAPLTIYGVSTDNAAFQVFPVNVELQPGQALLDSAGVPLLQVFYRGLSPSPQSGTLTIIHSDMSVGGLTEVALAGSIPGKVQVSPPQVDFGAVPVDVIVSKTVSVSGLGAVVSATTTGDPEFTVGSLPALPADVSTDAATIPVRCAPTGAGRFSGMLVIATNAAGNETVEVPLSCAAGPLLATTPASVNFGAVQTGDTQTRIVGVQNVGLETVSILSANTDGSGFSNVALDGPVSIAPGDSIAIETSFTPQQVGASNGTLIIQPLGAPPSLVPLTGVNGAMIALELPGSPIDFGVRSVGSAIELPVLITNYGSSAASFGSATVSSEPFSVIDVPVTGSIAPGEHIVFNVRFNPPVAGNYGGTLTIIADGQTTDIALTGKAGGTLLVAPDSLSFGHVPLGQATELPLGISNISPDTSVEVRVLQGGDLDAFTLVGLSDGEVLPPNTLLSDVTIQFNPPAERDYQSVFTFTTNDGVEGEAFTVTVTGQSGAQVSLIHPPAAFHVFESVAVGGTRSLPIRIAAPGAAATSIQGYFIEGEGASEFQFSVAGFESIPVVLPSESVLDLEVTCAPTVAGTFAATLYLATDTVETPLVPIKLWCSTPAALDVSPRRVTFGATPLLTPVEQTIAVSNVGSDPLLITSASVLVTEGATAELLNPLSGNTEIAPGDTRSFTIRFTAQSSGDFESQFVVSSNDPVLPEISVPLSAHSGPRIDISSEAVLFCGASTKTLSLVNTGTVTTAVNSVELSSEASSLQAVAVDGSGEPLSPPFFLEPGESVDVQVSWSGVLSGVDEAGGVLSILSDDPRGEHQIPVMAGRGWVVPDQFNGVADLGEPGQPAFPGILGTGLTGVEICTGGGLYGSHIEQALYAVRPGALGGAAPSLVWGQNGVIDLAAVVQSRPDVISQLDDLGSRIRAFDGGDLLAVAAPATGHWFLIRPNGELATSHPSGGVLSLSEVTGSPSVSGGLDRRASGAFVAIDRLSGTVWGLTEVGELDTSFGNNGAVVLGNTFPEYEVSNTVGESLRILANNSVAITDGATAQIFIVRPDGTPDTTLGANNSGVLTLDSGFVPAVETLGDLVRFGAGFAVAEPARNSLLFVGAGGGPIPGALSGSANNGRLRIIGQGGAFPAAGRLAPIVFQTTEDAVASPVNAGKWMLFDDRYNDILIVDDDGSGFEAGLPELQADCPVVIQQGQAGSFEITNSGQATLSITEATVSSADLACVNCAGTAIIPGSSSSLNVQWTVPEGVQGCFEEQLTLVHNGVNNPTTCPVLLGTSASFQVVPGSDSAYQYTFPPVSAGGIVTKDLVIRNAGCTPFTLQSLVLSGDEVFAVPPVPEEGVELAFGDVYVASVSCAPGEGGQYDGTLIFGTTSNVTTQPLQIFCTSGPYLERSANSLDWGSQALGTGGSRSISFTSSGGAPLLLSPVDQSDTYVKIENFADTPVGTFELLSVPAVGPELAVGESFDLTVIFTPPKHGEYSAELVVGSDSFDAAAGEIRIPLTGTSTAQPIFLPESLDFGVVAVGVEVCKSVDVQNNGAVNLSIQLQQSSLEGTVFRIEGNAVVPNILPFNSNTKTMELCCLPDAAGQNEVALDIALDGAASELTQYGLTCRGESCLNAVDAEDVLSFGDVRWDETVSKELLFDADVLEQVITTEVTGAGAEQVVVGASQVVDGRISLSVTITPSGEFEPVDATVRLTSDYCSTEFEVRVQATITPPEDTATDTDDATDGTESSEGVDATDQADGTDAADATSAGDDSVDTVDVTPPSTTAGGDDGCGCDMAPKQEPFPTGPAALLMLISFGLFRLRRRA